MFLTRVCTASPAFWMGFMWVPSFGASFKSRSAILVANWANLYLLGGRVDEWGETEEHGGQGELHGIMVLDGGWIARVWSDDIF